MEEAVKSDHKEKQAQAKRRIRNFLIDRRFQLRWVFRVMITISIIVIFMGYLLYRTVADATDQMLAQKLGDVELTKDSIEAFIQQSQDDKSMILWILILSLCTLVILLSLTTIVITHKVAGPIYKMRKVFSSISGDNLRLWDKLRRGDELQEAFDELADMLSRLREHRRRDTDELASIQKLVADKEGCEPAIQKIDRLIERYRDSVKMI